MVLSLHRLHPVAATAVAVITAVIAAVVLEYATRQMILHQMAAAVVVERLARKKADGNKSARSVINHVRAICVARRKQASHSVLGENCN